MKKIKKAIFFLEGLPGSGKTMLLKNLKKNGAIIIQEVINSKKLLKYHNKSNQAFFFRNDERKLSMAEKMNSMVIIDRSPLSTLFFNLAKFSIDQKSNPDKAFKWYIDKFSKKFRNNSVYHFFFIDISAELSIKRRGICTIKKDPWTNLKLLKFIRNLYLIFGKTYIKNFEIVNGDDNLEVILKNITSKINKNYD